MDEKTTKKGFCAETGQPCNQSVPKPGSRAFADRYACLDSPAMAMVRLAAVFGVDPPGAAEVEYAPHMHVRHGTHNSHKVLVALCAAFDNGISVVRVYFLMSEFSCLKSFFAAYHNINIIVLIIQMVFHIITKFTYHYINSSERTE